MWSTFTVNCEYRDGEICKVSSAMVSADISTYPATCNACSQQEKPKSINKVTCGLANLYVLQNKLNRADYQAVVDCFAVPIVHGNGPGTELKKILSWFVKPVPTCSCHARIIQMNQWGPDGCEQRIETILDWLQESAKQSGIPFVRFAVRLLVFQAIKNARNATAV